MGYRPTLFGAGLHNQWRANYAVLVSTASDIGDGFRPLSSEDVKRAIGEVKGAHTISPDVVAAVARCFLVRADRPVRFQVDRRQLGAIGVASITMSEMRIERLPFSRSNTVHVGIVMAGAVTITPRDGESVTLRVGEVSMITNWSLFDVACDEGTVVLHVLIPEARLRERGVRVRPARFRLEGPRTLTAPLLALASTLSDPQWAPTPTASRIAERVVEDLTVGLLLEWEDLQLDREDLRAQLRRRAIEEIAARHRDPDLSPTSLAKTLGVSLRHLQRGFENSGTTVIEQLVSHRTESAAELLASPGGSGLTVSEIARATGFGSAFELRSAFRSRYGVLPSGFRAVASVAPERDQTRAKSDSDDSERAIVIT